MSLTRRTGCLGVFGINITVGVEHARPILLMCRNYCRLLEGSSMLDPYNEHHPETGYAPSACFEPAFTGLAWYTGGGFKAGVSHYGIEKVEIGLRSEPA